MSQAALASIPKLQRAVLELILNRFDRYNDQASISENELKMFSDYGYNAAVVRGCLSELEKAGYFVRESGGSKLSTFSFERWHLGPKGLEFWQEQRDARQLGEDETTSSNESIEDIASIPASDRFVSLSDNAPEIDEVIETLENLAETIRGDNQYVEEGSQLYANKADKLAVESEIKNFTRSLKLERIRASVFTSAIQKDGILNWIAAKAAEGVIRDLAVKALKLVSDLCKSYGLF